MSKITKVLLVVSIVLFVAVAAATLVLFGSELGIFPEETVPTTEATTEATTEPTTEATTEPTTEPPTEPPVVIRHPLTGEQLEEPLTDRIFAVSISNIKDALPHIGVNDCDMFFEMFITTGVVRGLALYTDIENVPQIGSVRSTRINFADIALGYDAFLAHAGGSQMVLNYVAETGIDHKNIDTSTKTKYGFRDFARNSAGWGFVHCLFVDGPGLKTWAAEKEYRVSHEEEKTYNLNFVDAGALEAGDTANTISIDMKFLGSKKNTTMIYDPEVGEYTYKQYGKIMQDGTTKATETFKNVFILSVEETYRDPYAVANLLGTGDGFYASDGKIIPIKWVRENATDPFSFTMADGSPLYQNVGRSYVNLAPIGSEILCE